MHTRLNRRSFLKRPTGLFVAIGSVLAAHKLVPIQNREDCMEERALAVIDSHQHLWDLNRFRLPWLREGSPLARSFLMQDYLEATQGLNIVKAIYMEVDLAPEQQGTEADYVIDICKRGDSPTVAAVISGRPDSSGFRDYIMRYKDNPYINGVRQVLHNAEIPRGLCLRDQFVRSIRLLGELGMSYDLCLRPGELLDGAKLIDLCPATRFILDHCGNPNVQAKDCSQWERDIGEVAKRKNVVVKISGILASVKPDNWTPEDLAPVINHTLDAFGPDRVMYGGDWPVCTRAATYKQWFEALARVVARRSDVEKRKLFHDNAANFYGV